jgi:hypothetical protein
VGVISFFVAFILYGEYPKPLETGFVCAFCLVYTVSGVCHQCLADTFCQCLIVFRLRSAFVSPSLMYVTASSVLYVSLFELCLPLSFLPHT